MIRPMPSLKRRLLSGTVLSAAGIGVIFALAGSPGGLAQSTNPCAVRKPLAGKAVCNPCNPCNPCAAAANPCNPCAAAGAAGDRTYTIRAGDSLADIAQQTYGDPGLYRMLADYNGIADPNLIVAGQVIRLPANPCAALQVAAGPCGPCSPCSPCAAQAGASDCVVPRLQTAAMENPCAVSPCSPCNPCAAASPCNPCAAASPCNPCAAVNPCSPCAAAGPCGPCDPCAPGEVVELTATEAAAAYECIKGLMQAAYTGQLQAAAPCNPCAVSPCNPCAAASPCNPCAAANPCNPCALVNPCNPCSPCAAASPCNPCNPCAAANPCAATSPCNPCAVVNPCNPCGAANPCNPCAANPCEGAAITDDLMILAQQYQGWQRLNTQPYVSATHGSRYVNNFPAPEVAEAYARFEDVGTMPVGARIAKDSFTVTPDGRVGVGPLFLMEKMAEGFNAASDDWRYTMIMPDGSLFGMTGGQGSQNVAFCYECHALVADDQDSLFFLPEEFRVTAR